MFNISIIKEAEIYGAGLTPVFADVRIVENEDGDLVVAEEYVEGTFDAGGVQENCELWLGDILPLVSFREDNIEEIFNENGLMVRKIEKMS